MLLEKIRSIKIPIVMKIIVVGIIVIIISAISVEATKNNHGIEASNNVTVIVEIGIGVLIGWVFHNISKKEKKETDEKIKNIDDVADKILDGTKRLERFIYEEECKKIKLNIENLKFLSNCYEIINLIYEEIKQVPDPSYSNLLSHIQKLNGYFTRCSKLIDKIDLLQNDIAVQSSMKYKNIQYYFQQGNYDGLKEELAGIIKLGRNIKKYESNELSELEKLEQKYQKRNDNLDTY